MAREQLDGILWHIRKLMATETTSDRELLERFVQGREEAAFAALVQRHGPMVLNVCRRVLANVHDAEDACQAVFLVLARNAASIRRRDSLASWLHGVAFRTAMTLRRQIARQRRHEAPVTQEPQTESTEPSWREVCRVLDEELQRLPESLRQALVLCYLEGLTRDEAAGQLGWSVGTLRGRLERGREQLRRRLTRRGLSLPAALLAILLAEQSAPAALPAALAVSLVRAGIPATTAAAVQAGLVSPRAAALVEGVMKAMIVNKLKVAAVILLTLGMAGLGTGLLTERWLVAQAPKGDEAAASEQPDRKAKVRAAREREAGGQREQAVESSEQARLRAQSRLNLKEIALAMHSYIDGHGTLPPPAIYSGESRTVTGGGSPAGGGAGAPNMPGGGPAPPGGAAPGRPGLPGGSGAPARMGAMPPGGSGSMAPGGMGGSRGGGIRGMPGGMMPGMRGGMPGMPGMARTESVVLDGKPLLSWRVALLPFLGEGKLYSEFHLNERWDSPHNKKLLARMPRVYAPPGSKKNDEGLTYYQVFVGPGATFCDHQATAFPAGISDGTSNTLLVVEGGHLVPWTKPEDLYFSFDRLLPDLGGLFPGIFQAACADGAVYAFRNDWDDDSLRGAITANGGEVVDLDRFRVPVTPREAALREKNDKLKEAVKREEAELEALRRDLNLLREMNDDAATARLRKENAKLEKDLSDIRREMNEMKKMIEELKRDADRSKGKKARVEEEEERSRGADRSKGKKLRREEE